MAVRTQNMAKRQCPECKGRNTAKMLYGLPCEENWEEIKSDVDSGKIVLGGCCIPPFAGKYRCHDCGLEWAKKGGKIRVAPMGMPLDMLMSESGNERSAESDAKPKPPA